MFKEESYIAYELKKAQERIAELERQLKEMGEKRKEYSIAL